MKFWLQSLSENAFDVFSVCFTIIALILYHYLMSWRLNIFKQQIIEEIKSNKI
jgi:hypothetical protein